MTQRSRMVNRPRCSCWFVGVSTLLSGIPAQSRCLCFPAAEVVAVTARQLMIHQASGQLSSGRPVERLSPAHSSGSLSRGHGEGGCAFIQATEQGRGESSSTDIPRCLQHPLPPGRCQRLPGQGEHPSPLDTRLSSLFPCSGDGGEGLGAASPSPGAPGAGLTPRSVCR